MRVFLRKNVNETKSFVTKAQVDARLDALADSVTDLSRDVTRQLGLEGDQSKFTRQLLGYFTDNSFKAFPSREDVCWWLFDDIKTVLSNSPSISSPAHVVAVITEAIRNKEATFQALGFPCIVYKEVVDAIINILRDPSPVWRGPIGANSIAQQGTHSQKTSIVILGMGLFETILHKTYPNKFGDMYRVTPAAGSDERSYFKISEAMVKAYMHLTAIEDASIDRFGPGSAVLIAMPHFSPGRYAGPSWETQKYIRDKLRESTVWSLASSASPLPKAWVMSDDRVLVHPIVTRRVLFDNMAKNLRESEYIESVSGTSFDWDSFAKMLDFMQESVGASAALTEMNRD